MFEGLFFKSKTALYEIVSIYLQSNLLTQHVWDFSSYQYILFLQE